MLDLNEHEVSLNSFVRIKLMLYVKVLFILKVCHVCNHTVQCTYFYVFCNYRYYKIYPKICTGYIFIRMVLNMKYCIRLPMLLIMGTSLSIRLFKVTELNWINITLYLL